MKNCVAALALVTLALSGARAGELVHASDVDVSRVSDADMQSMVKQLPKEFYQTKSDIDLFTEQTQHNVGIATSILAEKHWQQTEMKKGMDWKRLWSERVEQALREVPEKNRESLKKILALAHDSKGKENAVILERVLKAKHGREDVWIVLLHWENASWVEDGLKEHGTYPVSHDCVAVYRASDCKLLDFASCP